MERPILGITTPADRLLPGVGTPGGGEPDLAAGADDEGAHATTRPRRAAAGRKARKSSEDCDTGSVTSTSTASVPPKARKRKATGSAKKSRRARAAAGSVGSRGDDSPVAGPPPAKRKNPGGRPPKACPNPAHRDGCPVPHCKCPGLPGCDHEPGGCSATHNVRFRTFCNPCLASKRRLRKEQNKAKKTIASAAARSGDAAGAEEATKAVAARARASRAARSVHSPRKSQAAESAMTAFDEFSGMSATAGGGQSIPETGVDVPSVKDYEGVAVDSGSLAMMQAAAVLAAAAASGTTPAKLQTNAMPEYRRGPGDSPHDASDVNPASEASPLSTELPYGCELTEEQLEALAFDELTDELEELEEDWEDAAFDDGRMKGVDDRPVGAVTRPGAAPVASDVAAAAIAGGAGGILPNGSARSLGSALSAGDGVELPGDVLPLVEQVSRATDVPAAEYAEVLEPLAHDLAIDLPFQWKEGEGPKSESKGDAATVRRDDRTEDTEADTGNPAAAAPPEGAPVVIRSRSEQTRGQMPASAPDVARSYSDGQKAVSGRAIGDDSDAAGATAVVITAPVARPVTPPTASSPLRSDGSGHGGSSVPAQDPEAGYGAAGATHSTGSGDGFVARMRITSTSSDVTDKDKVSLVKAWACNIVGFTGAHHFYLGNREVGIFYLCTLGCLGLGWLIDFFRMPFLVDRANAEVESQVLRDRRHRDHAYVLALPFGIFGLHHLYLRRKGWALLYMCTLGLLGVGFIIDLFRMGRLVDRANRLEQEKASGAKRNQPERFNDDAYTLWFPLGIFGAHHYYLGNPKMGVLYTFTLGLLLVGWIVDCFRMKQLVAEASSTLMFGSDSIMYTEGLATGRRRSSADKLGPRPQYAAPSLQ